VLTKKDIAIPPEFKGRTVWIKIVALRNGRLVPCSGGTRMVYDAPTPTDAGTWKPGAWTKKVKPCVCTSGYHVTTSPADWQPSGPVAFRVFWAECRGASSSPSHEDGKRKCAYEQIRLLRPVTLRDALKFGDTHVSLSHARDLLGRRLLGLAIIAGALDKIRDAVRCKKKKISRKLAQLREKLTDIATSGVYNVGDDEASALHHSWFMAECGDPAETLHILYVAQCFATKRTSVCHDKISTAGKHSILWQKILTYIDPAVLEAPRRKVRLDLKTLKVVPTSPSRT